MSVAFLPGELSAATITVAVAFGADPSSDLTSATWTDITTSVRFADKVVITIGRSDRYTTPQPASCLLTLNNRDGAWTAHEPMGAHWPFLVPNLPLRVQVTVSAVTVTRFLGYITGFPPSFDVSGREAVVKIEATGVTRRLGQGSTPLRSPLYRAIIADTTSKLAYWPVEDDGNDATQLAPGITGDTPMTVGGAVSFGGYTGLAGSAPLPTLSASSSFFGIVPRATAATHYQMDWHSYMPAAPGVDTVIMQANTTGTVVKWQIMIASDASSFTIRGYNAAGSLIVNDAWLNTFNPSYVGTILHWSLYAKQNGGNITYGWHTSLSLGGAFVTGPDANVAGTVGTPTGWWVPASSGLNGTSMGHFVIYDAYGYTQAGKPAFGYLGEDVRTRLTRLFLEQGETFTSTGFYVGSTHLGIQAIDGFMNIVDEACISSDSVRYDGLGAGMQWQSPSQRPDQASSLTIDASTRQLQPPFLPADDDLRRVNLMKVTNKQGSSATFEQPYGQLGSTKVGVYDSSLSASHEDDKELYSRAAWETHFGTADGLRYPLVQLNLRRTPTLAPTWLNITPGRGITLVPPFAGTLHPSGSVGLIAEGWTETLTTRAWDVILNCSNAAPYTTYQTNSTSRGRTCADQGQASTLPSGASTGATSLSVATPAGQPLWTTSAGDCPMDVGIDGIKVTVTAISGSSSPQTFTVTGATVLRALPINAEVECWQPGVVRLS